MEAVHKVEYKFLQKSIKAFYRISGFSGNGYYCSDINECNTMNGGCSMTPLVACINTPVR